VPKRSVISAELPPLPRIAVYTKSVERGAQAHSGAGKKPWT